MHTERERRFLLADRNVTSGSPLRAVITQGYMFARDGYAARVRRSRQVGADGAVERDTASAAFKGPRAGADREEVEIRDFPMDLAIGFLQRIPHKVVKTRYSVISHGETWEIDEFHDANEGLWIAECEFQYDAMQLNVPAWCGKEVTNDARFNNEELAMKPVSLWRDDYVAEFGPLGG